MNSSYDNAIIIAQELIRPLDALYNVEGNTSFPHAIAVNPAQFISICKLVMSAKLSPLAKGETVMVFHDPVTCQNLEGNAVLVKRHAVNSEGSERWQVRFEDDGFMAVRTVWKKHVI